MPRTAGLRTDAQRFWAKVDRRGPDDCWPWIGARDDFGRGLFTWNGRMSRAPRYALEDRRGSPLGPLFALHTCDNPRCVNPDHLWAGTQRDNARDCAAKGRNVGQKKTHCHLGHELTEPNTYRNRQGWRSCRVCMAARHKRARIDAKVPA